MKTEMLINENTCCGCRLCVERCPRKAIQMKQGELGILYPQIDEERCVDCHLCEKACPVHKELRNNTVAIYAAVNRQKNELLASASGGVFSAIAHTVLNQSGVVYGAAMLSDDDFILKVQHIRVDSVEQMQLLQGSKYLQSSMEGIYAQIQEDVKEGKTVLFSGTPCQIAAVKSLCGTPENLILAEIICHGVPSQRLFSDYLNTIQKKGKKIQNFIFRTKESGWGMCAKLTQKDKRGNVKSNRVPCNISSYYKMFLRCETYRPSCYQCKYATSERVGDLTLGDYWGIEKDNAIFDQVKASGFEITEGISCVIVSSEKGMQLLKSADISLIKTNFDSIARENGQLTHPSQRPNTRSELEKIYHEKGYIGLEERFNRSLGAKRYLILLRNRVPAKIRMKIRMKLGK